MAQTSSEVQRLTQQVAALTREARAAEEAMRLQDGKLAAAKDEVSGRGGGGGLPAGGQLRGQGACLQVHRCPGLEGCIIHNKLYTGPLVAGAA